MDDLRPRNGTRPTVVMKSVTAAAGDTLEVRLEWQATGFIWKLGKHDPKTLELVHEYPPRPKNGEENKPGAKSYKVFTFTILKEGEVEFVPVRSSGKPDPNIPGVRVTVRTKSLD
jgi:hypothetical protein